MLSSENARNNRGARYAEESYKRIRSKRQSHICVVVFVSHSRAPPSSHAHRYKKATEKVAAAIQVAMCCFMLAAQSRNARRGALAPT